MDYYAWDADVLIHYVPGIVRYLGRRLIWALISFFFTPRMTHRILGPFRVACDCATNIACRIEGCGGTALGRCVFDFEVDQTIHTFWGRLDFGFFDALGYGLTFWYDEGGSICFYDPRVFVYGYLYADGAAGALIYVCIVA